MRDSYEPEVVESKKPTKLQLARILTPNPAGKNAIKKTLIALEAEKQEREKHDEFWSDPCWTGDGR